MSNETPSPKSRSVTSFLAVFLGVVGGHRFYIGRYFTGFLMLITVGGLAVWNLIDIVIAHKGDFTDSKGRPVTDWLGDNFKRDMTISIVASAIVFIALSALLVWLIAQMGFNDTSEVYEMLWQELQKGG